MTDEILFRECMIERAGFDPFNDESHSAYDNFFIYSSDYDLEYANGGRSCDGNRRGGYECIQRHVEEDLLQYRSECIQELNNKTELLDIVEMLSQ